MNEIEDVYLCEQCGEEWGFFPEDYDNTDEYPTRCPLCSMTIWEMVRDVYKEEGILGVIRQLYLRLK